MVPPAASLTFTCAVKAPASELFQLFTSPSGVLAWLCHAVEVDPRPAGRL